MEQLKNHTGVRRRALGAPFRPPFGASRLSPASATPLGPGGAPPCDFSILPSIVKKSRYQQKSPRYLANPSYQAKKRRYLYNIANFITGRSSDFCYRTKLKVTHGDRWR